MIFAFLSATVMFICSLLALGVSIFLLTTRDPFFADASIFITFMALLGAFISVKGSYKLYLSSMNTLYEDFDKWYRKQQKIEKRSLSFNRLLVLQNIVYGSLAYEKLDEAALYLEKLGRLTAEKGNPYYNYIYLSRLLRLMEKKHDLSGSDKILYKMYEMLNSPYFPGGSTKSLAIAGFEYLRLEIEFYKRTPEMLRSTDRRIAEQFNAAAKIYCSEITGSLSKVSGYSVLACCYNIGLSCAVMGDMKNAAQYFEYITSSKLNFPLVSRVRNYLSTGDISVLMQTMP